MGKLASVVLNLGLFMLALFVSPTFSGRSEAADTSVNRQPAINSDGPFRKLAPGVLKIIPPDVTPADTHSTHDLVELLHSGKSLGWAPKYLASNQTLQEMATSTDFRHTIWNLEFSFKPLRMIWIDVPGKDGRLERRQIWYMVYRVRNLGGHLQPYRDEQGKWQTRRVGDVGKPIYFIPRFELYSHEFQKCYVDELSPVATGAIRRREDPNRPLLNAVEMSRTEIPLGKSESNGVWGVATWNSATTIDPRIDFFSVYVRGLSNAYHWKDTQGAFKPGDAPGTGRELTYKTLQLNFWRPGDSLDPHEDEIRFGMPFDMVSHYGTKEVADYQWIFSRGCSAGK